MSEPFHVPVTTLASCSCGSAVTIGPLYGGVGAGMTTAYAVDCPKCGRVMDELPSDSSGKKRDAVAEWNREKRKERRSAA